jgi:hypothetical protein
LRFPQGLSNAEFSGEGPAEPSQGDLVSRNALFAGGAPMLTLETDSK